MFPILRSLIGVKSAYKRLSIKAVQDYLLGGRIFFGLTESMGLVQGEGAGENERNLEKRIEG